MQFISKADSLVFSTTMNTLHNV